MTVQKLLSLDYASHKEHNKVAMAAMIQRLQEREGDTGSTVVQSEWSSSYYTPFTIIFCIQKYSMPSIILNEPVFSAHRVTEI